MALLRYFGVDFFLCFVRFFAVVDSSRRAAIVPGFVVDSSHPFIQVRDIALRWRSRVFRDMGL